jgi:TonB-dependent receptor
MRSLARSARSAGFIKLGLLATAAIVASPAFAQELPLTAASAPGEVADTGAAAQPSIPPADAPPTAEGDDSSGEIVVTGQRPIAESEAAALRVQRNSDSLVSVLSSDAVGRLPDQNIAQAVSRLPGVSVQRDQGQARYISLRGAPLNWTTLSFNGINVISPEGRDSRFDSIPAAIAKQVIVNKAVTPDMSGETISGNVDIITRSAFDAPGTRFAGKLAYGVQGLGPQDEFEGYALASTRWDTGIGDIGVLISGSYYARGINTDNFETDWEQVPQDTRPGNGERFWARETERKYYRATRRNYSVTGRLDYQPSRDHRFYAESIFTTFNDDEQRDNYIFDLDDQQSSTATTTALRAACPATAPTVPPSGTTGYADICLNDPFRGTVYGVDINANILIRRFRQSIFTNTLAGDHDFGGGWGLKWRGNYTRSVDDRSAPAQYNFESPNFANASLRPTVFYDLTDRNRSVVTLYRTLNTLGQLSQGQQVGNILDFSLPLTRVRNLDAQDTTKAYTGRVELERRFDFLGGESRLRFGAQYDERNKVARDRIIDRTGAQAIAAGQPGTLQDYIGTDRYVGTIPPGYDVRFFDIDNLLNRGRQLETLFPFADVTANFYDVGEKIRTGYAIYQGRFDWGSLIGGVRFENVRNNSNAFSSVTSVTNPNTTPPTTVTTNLPVEAQSETNLWFPSLHVNVDLDDTKKLRIGFTSGAARPDYDQLRPNLVVNDANLTISGGNPSAKPERAYGVDTYLEWYVRPQGFISVGVFYKRVEDVLFNTRRTFGSDALNFGGVDRSGYAFSGIQNGGDGYLYGAEGAFQMQLEPYTADLGFPEWLGGFGVSSNVVFNKSKVEKPAVFSGTGALLRAERNTPLPGTSDVTYNVGFYYEKYGLSLRAQYQRRSDWLDFVADTLVDGGDGYWRADEELDLSARYEVRKGVELLFDVANVLNGPGVRYVSDPRYTIEYEKFGRRYVGGVRFTF